jgi:hypothetical protein
VTNCTVSGNSADEIHVGQSWVIWWGVARITWRVAGSCCRTWLKGAFCSDDVTSRGTGRDLDPRNRFLPLFAVLKHLLAQPEIEQGR